MFRAKRRSPRSSNETSPDKENFSNGAAVARSPSSSPASLLIPAGNQPPPTEQLKSSSPRHVPKKQLFPAQQTRRLFQRKRKRSKQGFWEFFCTPMNLLLLVTFWLGVFLFSLTLSFWTVRWTARPTDALVHRTSSSRRAAPPVAASQQQPFELYSKAAPQCDPLPSASHVTFTLVTQFSDNRLWMMEHHCRRWNNNPISAAVLTTKSVAHIKQELVAFGCPDQLLSVQVVPPPKDEDYPVNLLRNMALAAVQTTHVAYVDVDFWESTDLYDTLQLHRETLATSHKTALVLPAFQLNRQCREWRECPEDNVPLMPTTQDELLNLVYKHRADRFDPTNKGGHGSTRYVDWFDQAASELLPISCVISNRYEPYLVFRYCRDLPPFQQAFTGYGKNKMTWIMHLRRAGYEFLQLGSSFVVHYPHLDSKARMKWNGGENGEQLQRPPKDAAVDWLKYKRGQIDQTFVEFRTWLHKNVPDQTRVPLCDNAMNDDSRLWIDRSKIEADSRL